MHLNSCLSKFPTSIEMKPLDNFYVIFYKIASDTIYKNIKEINAHDKCEETSLEISILSYQFRN
jgi:hypothetical protein